MLILHFIKEFRPRMQIENLFCFKNGKVQEFLWKIDCDRVYLLRTRDVFF